MASANTAPDERAVEVWDRLTLLLISQPIGGWEDTFEEITRREIRRCNALPLGNPSEENGDES